MNFYFLPKRLRLRHARLANLGDNIMDHETLDDRTAVAEYIFDLTAELAVMAARADHTDLVRILEMARLEAERLCGRTANAAEPVVEDPAPAPGAAGQSQSTNVFLLSALRAARR